MKKKIAILGSTGSIGKTTIDIIKKDIDNFDVILLTANNNYRKLVKQAKELKAKNLIINNKKQYLNLSRTEAEIELMKGLKQTLDPKNILNTGLIF